jgi:hypothetical protein
MVAEDVKPAGGVHLDQPRQEQATEQLRKDVDRQQEGRPRRYPALAVMRYAAAPRSPDPHIEGHQGPGFE